MTNQGQYKRKKFFLKNSSQPILIFKLYAILLAIMLISGAIFYFIGNRELTNELFKAHSVVKNTMQLLLPAIFVVNIIGLLGASFLVLTFTHSISGPLHRLRIISENIAQGDLSIKVKFREKDSIQELPDIINMIISGLKGRVQEVDATLTNMKMLSDQINNMDKLSNNELETLKNRLLSITAELDEKVKAFKL